MADRGRSIQRNTDLWRRWLEPLVHSPVLYDAIQLIAGDRRFNARLAPHLRSVARGARLVDLGGGTGLVRDSAARYVCLDLDPQKLRRFRAKAPRGLAVAADATACPFGDHTVDAVLCAKVVHHLDERQLGALVAEAARILKPGGVLIVADAVRSTRVIPRALWALDRGSFPRSAVEIRRALDERFDVEGTDAFRLGLFHDVFLCWGRPIATARRAE